MKLLIQRVISAEVVVDNKLVSQIKYGLLVLIGIAEDDDESKIEAAFNIKLQDHKVWLPGVLSRKKQVIPFVQPQF